MRGPKNNGRSTKGLFLLAGFVTLSVSGSAWYLMRNTREEVVASKAGDNSNASPRRSTDASLATPRFSAAEYQRDRSGYLAQVVPGRAFQVQSPRPGLPAIERVAAFNLKVEPLGSVELAVKAVPGGPVTFTSTGLGAFPNGRASISVAADAAGVARTQFTATRGTLGHARVFAACPLASGQVRFDVAIESSQPSKGGQAQASPSSR